MRRAVTLSVIAVLAASAVSAAEPETSKSFAFATYKEKRGPITILVGSFPAALSAQEAYTPLQVAVGVRGKTVSLTVTPESFSLVDADGKSYPMAGYEEMLSEDKLLRFTPLIDSATPLVTGQQFANSVRLAARFFPPPGVGTRIERVNLERATWFEDLLFFPRPDLGLDGTLTLRFRAAGMDEPIDVRFEVPLKGKRRRGR